LTVHRASPANDLKNHGRFAGAEVQLDGDRAMIVALTASQSRPKWLYDMSPCIEQLYIEQ
jgi:hypothetical protein